MEINEKYALIRLDKMRNDGIDINNLPTMLGELFKYFELSNPGSSEEAFVIKLKDKNSPAALGAYAASIYNNGDYSFANDVMGLLSRAGNNSPFLKNPD